MQGNKHETMKRIFTTYPLTILILAIILFLSLFNPPETEIKTITNIDKLAHLCMYGGFELILWGEYLKHHNTLSGKKLVLLAIVAPILYSGSMELAQLYLTNNRSGEWMDMVANTIGVITGAAAGYFVIRPILWRKK